MLSKTTVFAACIASAAAFNAPISKISETKASAMAAAAALTFAAAPAFAGDKGAGEAVFAGNCAACHAGGQNVIVPDKTLQQDVRDTTTRIRSLPRRAATGCCCDSLVIISQ